MQMNLKRKFPLISYSVSSQVTAGKKTPTFFQLNYEDKILKSDGQQFPVFKNICNCVQ
jgi:hypothetical protein